MALRRAILAVAGSSVPDESAAEPAVGSESLAIFSVAPPLCDAGVQALSAHALRDARVAAALSSPHILVVAPRAVASQGDVAELSRLYGELLARAASKGWTVLPGDDPLIRRMAGSAPGKVLWYGRGADCDLVATHVAFQDGRLEFRLGQQQFRMPAWGRFALEVALAAIGVGHLLGVPLPEMAAALARLPAHPGRTSIVRVGTTTLIHEGETTVRLAESLQLLREFPTSGQRLACIGDLAAGGSAVDGRYHELADQLVCVCGVDGVVACGASANHLVKHLRAAGMPPERAVACERPQDAAVALRGWLRDDDVVLAAGAPPEQLAQVLESLREALTTEAATAHAGPGEISHGKVSPPAACEHFPESFRVTA